MSIILGIGLASLFRKMCKGRHCQTVYAAPADKFEGKTFTTVDGCVQYTLASTQCPAKGDGTRVVKWE